jgi:hypothetical protein
MQSYFWGSLLDPDERSVDKHLSPGLGTSVVPEGQSGMGRP